jgi:predicted nucleic acid-binding Zn ribbon protein
MSSPENRPVARPDGGRAPATGRVVGSRTCPICSTAPLTARQEVCSGRCRAALSRQRKAEAQRERDAEIRALLEAAVKRLREDP